jgi:uncharacterized protein YggE
MPSRPVLSGVIALALFICATANAQQNSEIKIVADTLIVQAQGTFEADPDIAVLAFDVATQDKELRQAYAKASQSMRTITSVAERNGLAKDAIHTGVLTVTPLYESYRNRKARAYRVEGEITLKVQDFSKVGPIMDDAIQDGVADFRSLTYSLADEEAAKKKAVADAMRRAVGRATAALEQSHQKLGPARYVNLEVTNLIGVSQVRQLALIADEVATGESENGSAGGLFHHDKRPPAPPPPPVQPERISIGATVQCAFQIER